MSWEITSDSTNTEVQSDNNGNFNFVTVVTDFQQAYPGTLYTMNNSVKAEDVCGQWASASMDLGQVICTLRPMGTIWSTPFTLSRVAMSTV
jgi:hypothetical protein